MNRLTQEIGFDQHKTHYHYNAQGELAVQDEFGNQAEVQRQIRFERDELGRLVSQQIEQGNQQQRTDYYYDLLGRLTQVENEQSTVLLDYDKVGRITQQRVWDRMGNTSSLRYDYDKNGNRLQTLLPNQQAIQYLYYGSGHLAAIKYQDRLISEFSRDKLHREIGRTQGKLTSVFSLEPLGRLTEQLSSLADMSHEPVVKRQYQYDQVGNLRRSEDLRTGVTGYHYDALGQITLAGTETFAFDPAHNLIEQENQKILTNQVSQYQGVDYRYDTFGNLTQRISAGEEQHYHYNTQDQLIEAIIYRPNQAPEQWHYQYDALGRRIAKVRSENGKFLAESRIEFIWDGSHLLQEKHHKTDHTYQYIYSHPASYEPLAQVENDGEKQTIYYFHCDQIGIPRELTDEQGKLCWYGDYQGWGAVKNEYALTPHIHQPFRLQNQYYDQETGLHYNFYRYYDPHMGRFTQRDPIKLLGGNNLYRFEGTIQNAFDPMGLIAVAISGYQSAVIGAGAIHSSTDNSNSISMQRRSKRSSASIEPKVSDKAIQLSEAHHSGTNLGGNCTPGELETLQGDKNYFCNQKRNCDDQKLSDAEIFYRVALNRNCAMTRDKINKKCFAGGDLKHQKEAENAWVTYAKCQEKLSKYLK